jgi:hypothetical protein
MPRHNGNKKASRRIIPAGQRISIYQPNQICGATLIAPLQPFSHGERIHHKASPVGLSRARSISHKEEPESSWIHIRKVRWTMKKLHPNCPPKGAPIRGFARSVIHWRSRLRIYPKTAKAFPLRGKKGGNDKRQLTLAV